MDNFLEKWKKDKKYRTKIKLILYTTFVLVVAIYALSINNQNYDKDEYLSKIKPENNNTNNVDDIIKINDTYKYTINIEIDDKEYEYSGIKDNNQTTITKKVDDTITNYIYKNNEYYIEDNNNYIVTTKDSVYDIINYNYINIDSIKEYLKKAKNNNNNQYLVYIKDIILASDSDNYFIIDVVDNNLYIDYTPLMKEFNNNITNYKVSIKIEE